MGYWAALHQQPESICHDGRGGELRLIRRSKATGFNHVGLFSNFSSLPIYKTFRLSLEQMPRAAVNIFCNTRPLLLASMALLNPEKDVGQPREKLLYSGFLRALAYTYQYVSAPPFPFLVQQASLC